jgi:hypothetical protein
MSTKSGALERAFRGEVDSGAVLGMPNDPAQLDLLREDNGNLPKNVFQIARQKGVGRPQGAKNKRNESLAKLVCQQHGDPVLFMASLYSMPLDQVVELMKIAAPGSGKAPAGDLAAKALAVQLQAAKEVSQYVHSKKPIEANVNVHEDFRAIFVGSSPEQIALQRAHDAVNSGMVSREQITGMRIIEGEFSVVDEDEDEAE